jgi:hypothetical protein
MRIAFLVAALVSCGAMAQVGAPSAFPAASTVPTAQGLRAYLSGKAFRTTYASGATAHMRFGADGLLSASLSTGFTDSGQWRVEDGKLCGSLRESGDFCNDARFDAGTLYLRRISGEILRYEPE